MELKNLAQIELATMVSRQEFLRLGTAILFLVGVLIYSDMMAALQFFTIRGFMLP